MNTINVIERVGPANLSVDSFDGKTEVKKAEKMFLKKARENHAKWDDNYLLDEGFYQNGEYELYLLWSE